MDQTLPRISVIMPNFNQARYLERAICSVLDQGYDNLEFVIVDGGSCDDSLRIIQRYEDDLEWWISRPDDGAADAINYALKNVTGELVTVLSSDDVLLPFTLLRVAERYMTENHPAWIVGGVRQIDLADRTVDLLGADTMFEAGDEDLATVHQPISFRRPDVFERFGVFNRDLLHAFEYDYNCRLRAGGLTPSIIDDPIVGQRLHGLSLSGRDPLGCRREHTLVTHRYAPAAALKPDAPLHLPRPKTLTADRRPEAA